MVSEKDIEFANSLRNDRREDHIVKLVKDVFLTGGDFTRVPVGSESLAVKYRGILDSAGYPSRLEIQPYIDSESRTGFFSYLVVGRPENA